LLRKEVPIGLHTNPNILKDYYWHSFLKRSFAIDPQAPLD